MKTVVVTGAGGRLGQVVVRALLKKRYSVRAIVRPGGAKALKKARGLSVFEADLLQAGDALLKPFLGADYAVNTAGRVDYTASFSRLVADNAVTAGNVCQAAFDGGVKKLVHVSTAGVYEGTGGKPITEQSHPRPLSNYARSKLEAERRVVASGVPYVILRPPAIYGAPFLQLYSNLVRMVERKRAVVVGSGRNKVSFVHCDDLADAVVTAMESKVVNDDFIISNPGVTQLESFAAVAKALGVEPPSRHVPAWAGKVAVKLEALRARLLRKRPLLTAGELRAASEDRYYDCSKAARLLGWRPRVAFGKGMVEMVRAYRQAAGARQGAAKAAR